MQWWYGPKENFPNGEAQYLVFHKMEYPWKILLAGAFHETPIFLQHELALGELRWNRQAVGNSSIYEKWTGQTE